MRNHIILMFTLGAGSFLHQQDRRDPQPLPKPSGPHAVGTMTVRLVDSTRATSRRIRQRPITVQVWYPAAPGTGVRSAPYVDAPALIDSMIAHKYLELDSATITGFRNVRVAATVDASPANPRSRQGWPVLVFSHGLGVARSGNTALSQELASHGYAVLTVDHPIGGFTFSPAGSVLTPGIDSLHYPSQPIVSVVSDWAVDAELIVRRVSATLASKRIGGRVLRLDVARVAMLGHSLGGAAALEACRTRPLFKACVDMDGDPFGAAETERIGKPILVLLSQPNRDNDPPPRDSAEAARRRAFSQMGRERDSMWAAICGRNGGVACSFVKLKGTGHMSFSDAPFVAPALLEDVGATLEPVAAFRIIADRLLAFFGAELR